MMLIMMIMSVAALRRRHYALTAFIEGRIFFSIINGIRFDDDNIYDDGDLLNLAMRKEEKSRNETLLSKTFNMMLVIYST